ncbi:putative oligomeric golgi complex component 8 [Trypanosoma rangeli]|uniref:Conserved oligomeric Golgi complex subunit 8 n=1 Tax=Trypanosoma rangeli TaxID=5698 RepID=A0A3R7LW05_TRYRA|nr:putative oligomeric golgi complex component 8 [Trypanosoma rangeli]RNF04403.1 putative oligomeric golgi complex component 8 [Trypanosoma rangeli]|eukprot:RNF04403.1 putative oligomeric golgi complex component 8 [Trypanosoma rangeli]
METSMSDEEGVRRGIVEAAVEHYSLLSGTQEVNAKVAAASGSALSCVKRLNDSLGKLQTLSQAMTRVGQQWRREKQIALGTVAQHQKLLAFLEAPAVFDDCIRNEMYHEALMVLEHITRSSQPMAEVELFRRVEVEVRCNLERALSEVVFPRLAQQLTVASAVKVTTFLRRLGVDESQIRRLFLWKRAEYVDGFLREAEESEVAYSRIFRYVAAFKVHVSEAIMQYTACFSPTVEGGACSELVAWCHQRVYVFLDGFRASLDKITNGSELSSVIEECNSCSATATLLHMDVSGLLNESLISRVKTLFAEQIALSMQSYTASMATFSWRTSTGPQWSSSLKRAEPTSSSNSSMSPPLSLLQWLPLAYALNGLLTAFNTIRKCVVPGVKLFCVSKVEGLLQTVAKDLARDKELLMAMEGGEKQVYLLFVEAFVNDFYAHVLVCIRELLGNDAQRLLENGMRGSIESLRSILPTERHTASCGTPQKEQQVMNAASFSTDPQGVSVAPSAVGT